MAVLAIFRYDVKLGRTGDFIEKLCPQDDIRVSQ